MILILQANLMTDREESLSVVHSILCMTRVKTRYSIYRGSYMGAHVLLNLLNELGEKDKMRGFLTS